MILKVLTHVGVVHDDVDVQCPQMVGRPDAGQHQQLWGSDASGGQDDLVTGVDNLRAPVGGDGHPDGALVLDHDLQRLGACLDGEVLA